MHHADQTCGDVPYRAGVYESSVTVSADVVVEPRKTVEATPITADELFFWESVPDDEVVLMDIRTCPLTLSGAMAWIREAVARLPRHEVFLDGDRYAVVARPRRDVA